MDSAAPRLIDWIFKLNPSEEVFFGCLMSIQTWHATKEDPHQSRGRCMAQILVESALEALDDKHGTNALLAAVKLSVGKDLRLKRAFFKLGLQLIVRYANEAYLAKHQISSDKHL